MFSRVLFLLLLALNIGGACWIAFAPPPVEPAPAPTDPGVPLLVLLSERDGAAQAGGKTLASANRPRADNETCVSIGPFRTQSDMRATLSALTPHVLSIQFRDEQSTQSRGYWVYLPALDSREAALGVARQLSAKGVRDYYVVTAGDQLNTISLGLFRERANAERRTAEITAMGFRPSMNERTEELPVYWIDYVTVAEAPVDWRRYASNPSELEQKSIACF